MFNMKASISSIHNRRLLQQEFSGDSMEATLSPQPVLGHIKNTSISNSKRPFNPNTQLDSSMALTILILLTFLFFISFFSVYINIRRFSNQETSDISRRRAPSPASRVVVMKKGLDPSTISALPLVSYRRSAKQGNIEDCIICLSEFEEGEMMLIKKGGKNYGNELGGRSTAEDGDTSQKVVGSNEIRR
ncbi:hypothetical protein Leryth_013892 [Lithospermum erythrorhizon]|nr:hypothetical protein Leryth_013892 [Lithospermum erythrorhizon]